MTRGEEIVAAWRREKCRYHDHAVREDGTVCDGDLARRIDEALASQADRYNEKWYVASRADAALIDGLRERAEKAEAEWDEWKARFVILFGSDNPEAAARCVKAWADRLNSSEASCAAMREALEATLHSLEATLHSTVWGHDHWDRLGTHGANCLLCIQQGIVRDNIRKALASDAGKTLTTGQDASSPSQRESTVGGTTPVNQVALLSQAGWLSPEEAEKLRALVDKKIVSEHWTALCDALADPAVQAILRRET